MPQTPRPFWDERCNRWRLRFKKVLPDGTVKRHWHLASGKQNYARALARAAEIMGRPVPGPAEVTTVAGAIDAFLDRFPGKYRERMLRPLYLFAGNWPLADLPSGILADYRDWLKTAPWTDVNKRPRVGYGPKSIRGYVGYAAALFRWCAHRDRRWIEDVPDRPALPKAPKGHRHVAGPLLRAAFDTLPKRAKAVLSFIVCTGCRPSEGMLLEWDQVDLEGGVCRLPPEKHKTGGATGRDRVLFLTDAAKLILHTQRVQQKKQGTQSRYVFTSRLGRPYTPTGLRKILQRRGINGTYQLRHTFAQDARRQGVDLATISLWLGHASIKTTEIYVEIEREEGLRAAASLASPLRPPPPAGIDGAAERTDAGGRKRRPRTPRRNCAG